MSAVLRCYVDDETLRWLEKASAETGRNIEQLAEAAIESAAIEYKVSRMGAFPSTEQRVTPPGSNPNQDMPPGGYRHREG